MRPVHLDTVDHRRLSQKDPTLTTDMAHHRLSQRDITRITDMARTLTTAGAVVAAAADVVDEVAHGADAVPLVRLPAYHLSCKA